MHIHTPLFATFRSLDTLAIQNASARLGLTSMLDTHLLDQGFIDPLPDAVFLPPAKVAIDRLPRWQVGGKHAPLATRADHIQDRIEDLPRFPVPWATQSVGWKRVCNQLPFGILEIGRVSLGEFSHSPILPDHLRNTL